MSEARGTPSPPLQGAGSTEAERLSSILEIGRALGSTLNLDLLLRLVVAHGGRLLDAERCTVFVHDAERRELWSRVAQGLGEGPRQPRVEEGGGGPSAGQELLRIPDDRGLVGAALKLGRPVLVQDAYADPRFDPSFDRATGYRTRSVLAVPLHSRAGDPVGVLQALNKRDGSFGAEDEELALALAGQIAAAIENGRLYQAVVEKNAALEAAQRRLEKALREIDALYEVEQEVSLARDVDPLLDAILQKAVALSGAQAGSVLLAREEGGGDLFFHSAVGEQSSRIVRTTLASGRGLVGAAAASGKSILTNDPASDPRFDAGIAQALGYPIASALAVPIAWDGARLGALELLNKKGGPFDEEDLRLATLVAGQAARAIHRTRGRAEQERRGRLQLVGQMLSGLLHDLRTPMTIVSGHAQLLERELDPEQRRRSGETILRQVDLVSSMTGEVLAFVRGERALLIRRLSVTELLDEMEEFLRHDLAGRPISFELVRSWQGHVRCDEAKVKRVVFNLVRNAVQAMPGGGSLVLRSEREGDRWLLSCEDTGSGIPPEIQGRLFEEFVSHGKAGGTGLGLALCKKIAEEHGGEIGFSSRPGKGTCFTLSLPLHEEAPLPSAGPPADAWSQGDLG